MFKLASPQSKPTATMAAAGHIGASRAALQKIAALVNEYWKRDDLDPQATIKQIDQVIEEYDPTLFPGVEA